MERLYFCIAVAPLAVYFLMLGLINIRNRPFVTTGARDLAGLGIGLVGFVAIGPLELFFPENAASRFGPLVWAMLIAFYGLCVSLAVLLLRLRIVVYNVSLEQLRPILTSVAMKLDPQSRWVGDSLHLPDRKVHLHVEPVHWIRNIQLTAGGKNQSLENWLILESELRAAFKKMPVGGNSWGFVFLALSVGLAAASLTYMLGDQQAVASAWDSFLRK